MSGNGSLLAKRIKNKGIAMRMGLLWHSRTSFFNAAAGGAALYTFSKAVSLV